VKITAIILIVSISAIAAFCQDMQVPIEQQVPLLAKILSFDRNLAKRAENEIVFAIVYQKKFRKSYDAKINFEETVGRLSLTKVDSLPIRFISIDISDDTNLSTALEKNGVNVLYMAPIKAIKIDEITAMSRRLQISSLTGVADYVDKGVAVGIGAKGDRPEIIINLAAAKAEGINFNSQLLKLAKIIQ
jgi:hypothetical protein